ncbi:hypothetical protein, partial [Escherichia marmotae]|uniref:hypothetical protein n=1 Tax=Escherichia marmotae TaxID=1499973 RepID=UPI00215A125C
YHLSPIIFGGKVKYQRRQYGLKNGQTVFTPPGECCPGGGQWLREDYAYAKKIIKVDTGEVYKSGKNMGEPKLRNETVDDYDKPKSRMVDD